MGTTNAKHFPNSRYNPHLQEIIWERVNEIKEQHRVRCKVEIYNQYDVEHLIIKMKGRKIIHKLPQSVSIGLITDKINSLINFITNTK